MPLGIDSVVILNDACELEDRATLATLSRAAQERRALRARALEVSSFAAPSCPERLPGVAGSWDAAVPGLILQRAEPPRDSVNRPGAWR